MKKKSSFFSSLTFNIVMISTITILILSVIVGWVGYLRFTESLTEEYNTSALNVAKTANKLFISGDYAKLFMKYRTAVNLYMTMKDDFDEEKYESLFNGTAEYSSEDDKEMYVSATEREKEEIYDACGYYAFSLGELLEYCDSIGVNVVYVIMPDVDDDYKSYRSVINAPSTRSGYKPWTVGYVQKTGEDYIEKYKRIFAGTLTETTVVRDKNLNGGVPHTTSAIPVYDSENNVVAITCVQTLMSELAEGRNRYIAFVAVIMVIIAAAAIVLSVGVIRKNIIVPLKKVVDEAERFAKESSAPEKLLTGGISRINEISTLAESLDEMETATLKYIANLSDAIAEKQRISADLQVASIIQESAIPTNFPAFPEKTQFDLYATMRTAKAVGGDFYDFFLIDDDHLALVMADVSGKGVPASLFMMVNKILLYERAMMGGQPTEIMEFVNDRICANNKAEMFVTIWFGVLEISTGKVTAVNAGHDAPAIMRKGGDFELLKAVRGVVVGAMPGIKYKQFEFTLEKGDKMFLYTDGIPEATTADEKMFTIDGMLGALNKLKGSSAKEIIEKLFGYVDEFVGGAPQFDDMTALCINYFGNDDMDTKVLKVDATDDNLDVAMGFMTECLEENDCSMKLINQLSIAFEEIFVNVAHYAYRPNIGEVEIRVKLDDGKVVLTFIDGGVPYNPLEKADPDVTLSAAEREIGGLGIYMTKKLVDNVIYEYVDNKNILTLEKKL